MQIRNEKPKTISDKDDDIQFDRENVTTTDSQTSDPEQQKTALPENAILPDQELIDKDQVVPLSEEEKQPKLADEERIREMNRKTSLGD